MGLVQTVSTQGGWLEDEMHLHVWERKRRLLWKKSGQESGRWVGLRSHRGSASEGEEEQATRRMARTQVREKLAVSLRLE